MLILCKDQKVDTKKEEHSTFRAQKNQKITFTTCINTISKPKGLYFYKDKLLKNVIKE